MKVEIIKLWSSLWNIFHLVGVLVLQKSSKILLHVSLKTDRASNLYVCFLQAPPLSLHLLPSLISHCSDLPSGTQGRSGKQESTPYKHRMGDPKVSVRWSPTWFCSFSALASGIGMEMPLSVIQSCVISGSGWLNFLLITDIFLYFFVYLIVCDWVSDMNFILFCAT